MAGKTPSCDNIKLGTHVFIQNPSSMTLSYKRGRTIKQAIDGTHVVNDILNTSNKVIQKRHWEFSGIDDGDLDIVLSISVEPGDVLFRDIYGEEMQVIVDDTTGQSPDGKTVFNSPYTFSLTEV